MKEYALNELQEWMEDNNIRKVWEDEDDENVMVYQSKSLDIICVRKDADGNVIDAWME
jgi:hypothetical protein